MYEVFYGSKKPDIQSKDHNFILSAIFKYSNAIAAAPLQDEEEYMKQTAILRIEDEKFTMFKIDSGYKSFASSVVIENDPSPNKVVVLILSNFSSILLQCLETTSQCFLLPARLNPTVFSSDVIRLWCEEALGKNSSYDNDTQTVLSENLPPEYKDVVNALGNIELVFQMKNRNLNEMCISVPKEDVIGFLPHFHRGVRQFVYDETTINTDNLSLTKFISNGFMITDDGRVRLGELISDAWERCFVACMHS